MRHQDLPVAIRPAADADGGHGNPSEISFRHRRRDQFQHNGKRAGLGQRLGVIQQFPMLASFLPLM